MTRAGYAICQRCDKEIRHRVSDQKAGVPALTSYKDPITGIVLGLCSLCAAYRVEGYGWVRVDDQLKTGV